MLALDAHPHARAVLGAALREEPAHAYLLHGPAGTGKREAARAFAGELLARGAKDPENAKLRARHGAHPDLTWVAPSGARDMLRGDVDEAVVAAAAHTPFEARYRIFVLERADTLIEQAANALLKTLEEPPAYVVLMLLTDKPTQVLPTIASRCQPVRFDPLPTALVAQGLTGIPEPTATACARLSLGDGEKAKQLAFGDGPRLRAAAEALARAPLHGTTAQQRPWLAILQHARAQGTAARELLEKALAEELEYLPKKEHKRRQTEYAERARRADRRAATETLDHALQLAGLWYRDLAAVRAGAPELAFHADRAEELEADAHDRDPRALTTAQELVDDTRARLILNVSEELACEALAYRLEATLS